MERASGPLCRAASSRARAWETTESRPAIGAGSPRPVQPSAPAPSCRDPAPPELAYGTGQGVGATGAQGEIPVGGLHAQRTETVVRPDSHPRNGERTHRFRRFRECEPVRKPDASGGSPDPFVVPSARTGDPPNRNAELVFQDLAAGSQVSLAFVLAQRGQVPGRGTVRADGDAGRHHLEDLRAAER